MPERRPNSFWIREVQEATAEYKRARYQRDYRIMTAVVFGYQSRREIAKAAGLSKARVDQIVKGVREGA